MISDVTPMPQPGIFSDLDALRLSPETAALVAPEVLTTVPVRKPGPTEFFCTNAENSLTTTVFIDKAAMNELYLIPPASRSWLAGEMKMVTLVQAKSRQGVDFIIPVGISEDGRPMAWYESMREAVIRANTKWVRVKADMSLGAYRIYEAQGNLGEPAWPDMAFSQMLDTGFRSKIIDGEDHPIIRRLRGLE